MKLRPRWIARFLSWALGYFWLPCPICGQKFSGFEWAKGNTLMIDIGNGRGVCPDCGDVARLRNHSKGYASTWDYEPFVRSKR